MGAPKCCKQAGNRMAGVVRETRRRARGGWARDGGRQVAGLGGGVAGAGSLTHRQRLQGANLFAGLLEAAARPLCGRRLPAALPRPPGPPVPEEAEAAAQGGLQPAPVPSVARCHCLAHRLRPRAPRALLALGRRCQALARLGDPGLQLAGRLPAGRERGVERGTLPGHRKPTRRPGRLPAAVPGCSAPPRAAPPAGATQVPGASRAPAGQGRGKPRASRGS